MFSPKYSDINQFFKNTINYLNITIYCAKITITDIHTRNNMTNYFNCNIIPTDSTIDKYGLYTKYIIGYDSELRNYSFISKPIEYKKQINKHNLSLIYDESMDDVNRIIVDASTIDKQNKTNYVILKPTELLFPLNLIDIPIMCSGGGGDCVEQISTNTQVLPPAIPTQQSDLSVLPPAIPTQQEVAAAKSIHKIDGGKSKKPKKSKKSKKSKKLKKHKTRKNRKI